MFTVSVIIPEELGVNLTTKVEDPPGAIGEVGCVWIIKSVPVNVVTALGIVKLAEPAFCIVYVLSKKPPALTFPKSVWSVTEVIVWPETISTVLPWTLISGWGVTPTPWTVKV